MQKNLGENGSFILFFDYNDKELECAVKAFPPGAVMTGRTSGLGITTHSPPRSRAVGSGEAAFQPPGLI
jgi:hypothetical protein